MAKSGGGSTASEEGQGMAPNQAASVPVGKPYVSCPYDSAFMRARSSTNYLTASALSLGAGRVSR